VEAEEEVHVSRREYAARSWVARIERMHAEVALRRLHGVWRKGHNVLMMTRRRNRTLS
jgi:hypothetical protein